MSIKGDLLREGFDVDFYYLTGNIQDISSATANLKKAYVTVPVDGLIVEIKTVISNAITAANALINMTTSTGAVTGTTTITQSGSAAGDKDSTEIDYHANALVDAGDTILVTSNSGSSTACNLGFQIKIRRRS